MSTLATQTYFMGPLSALSRDVNQEESIFRDLIMTSEERLIDEFNYLVDVIIPSQFIKDHVVSPSLTYKVTGVEVHFPFYYVGSKGRESKRLLTPHIAKMTGQNYMCQIVCNSVKYNPLSGVSQTETRAIGSIECMVGSNRCVTSIKPDEIETLDEWKMMLGEDPSIPGGYFIKAGAKKVVLYGEKLGTNTFFSIETKGDIPRVETRITEMSKSKTTVIRLQSGKHRASVKVLGPHLRGKHYPLFLVLYLLLFPAFDNGTQQNFDVDVFIDYISKKAPKKEQAYVAAYLDTSKSIFYTKFCLVDDKGEITISHSLINEYIAKKIRGQNIDKSLFNPTGVSSLLFNEISPSKTTSAEKIANICLMTSQHIRCCLKLRPFDSRDSWANKKLDSAVRLIEQNIADIFIERLKTGGTDDKSWKLGKNDKNENIVESLKVDSNVLIRSLLSKINAIVDPKTKNFSVRAVAFTGYGVVCPAKTSEGVKCGINKHVTICTRISYNSEHIRDRLNPIFELVKYRDYSSPAKSEIFPFGIIITDGNKEVTLNTYVSDKFMRLFSSRNPNIKIEIRDNNAVIFFESLLENQNIPTSYNDTVTIPLKGHPIIEEFLFCFLVINDFISIKRAEPYNFSFTYDGNLLLNSADDSLSREIYPISLWVNPDTIVPVLKEERRRRRLPVDCCIYRNNRDYSVQYYDDSGRLMCPYLVADSCILGTLKKIQFFSCLKQS